MRYLKGHLWLTVKAETGTVEHGAYDKNKQVLFYEKQKVFTSGQNAEMSNLETIRSLDLELCKHGTHFSLIIVFKSTLPH